MFPEHIVRRYEGTRLGRQKLNAEFLDDVPGALWEREKIDTTRVYGSPSLRVSLSRPVLRSPPGRMQTKPELSSLKWAKMATAMYWRI